MSRVHRSAALVAFASLLACSRNATGRESTTTRPETAATNRPELIEVVESMRIHAPLVVVSDLAVSSDRPEDLHASLGLVGHGSSSWSTESAILITRSIGAAAVFQASGAELDDHAVLVSGNARASHVLHVASTTPRGEQAFAMLATEVPALRLAEGAWSVATTLRADLGRAHELLPHPMLIGGNEDLLQELTDQRDVAFTYALAHTPVATLRTLIGKPDRPLRITSVQIVGSLGDWMSAAVRGGTREDIGELLKRLEPLGPMQVEFAESGSDTIAVLARGGGAPREVFELADATTAGFFTARMQLARDELLVEYRVVPGAIVGRWSVGAVPPNEKEHWPGFGGEPQSTPFTTPSSGEDCLRGGAEALLDGFERLGKAKPAEREGIAWDSVERAMPSFVCAQEDPRTAQRARNLLRLTMLGYANMAELAPRFCKLSEDVEICRRAEGER